MLRRSRHTLLSATAVIGLAPALAGAPETLIGLSLTPGPDLVSVLSLDARLDRDPDFWGLVPAIRVVGVDALAGADSVTFGKGNRVTADVEAFRLCTSFPADPTTIADLLAPPVTAGEAVGADGGAGADTLRITGDLDVRASGLFVQADLDIGQALPAGYVFALDATLDIAALGLAGGAGDDSLENAGSLSAIGRAEAGRGELAFATATFGDVPQNLTASARALGLDGGAGNDRLTNATGAVLAVRSQSEAVTVALTLTGVTVSSPSNATVALADSLGMAGGDGQDRLLNAGLATFSSRAEIIEADVTAAGTTIGVTEYLLPDTTQDTQAEARSRGMTGGGGADQLENSGLLLLSAEAVYGFGGLFIGDAFLDTTAIDVLIDPPAIPEEPAAGAVARVTGMDGDDGDAGDGSSDILTNRGSITGTADATSASLDIFLALPINSMTGVGDTAVGEILSAFSLALTDVSADSAAFATGITGGAFRDIITQAGSQTMTASATALLGQVGVDFSSLIPSSDEEDDSGGLPFSIGLGVYSVGANAYAEVRGVEGGTGLDLLSSTSASQTTTSAAAAARTLDVNLSLSKSDDFNVKVNGSAFFARSWAAADAVGFDGGADVDQFSLLGSTTTTADALAQSLSVGLTVNVGKSGAALSASYADADVLAEARAAALRAADAQDRVVVGGAHTTVASAAIEAIAVSANFQVTSEKGFAGTAAFISADQQATASAVGIDRAGPLAPEPGAGFNWPIGRTDILAGSVFLTTAVAGAERIGVSAQVGGSAKGLAVGAAATEVAQSAHAKARGLAGSDDADLLAAPSLTMLTTATADTFSTATSLGVGVVDAGVGAGLGLVLASTKSVADAAGIALGTGADGATLGGQVLSVATATNWNNGNALELAGANNGVGLGAALAFMETTAEARARAVDLGAGADSLVSSASLAASAIADTKVDMFSIALSGAVNGVGGSVSFARTGGSALADGVAADLGDGSDVLVQSADISATAGATIETQAGGIALGANYQGVGAGVGMIDLTGDAFARAVGSDGGDGDDDLRVLADVDATAGAHADSLDIAVGLGITVYGLAPGVLRSCRTSAPLRSARVLPAASATTGCSSRAS